jgi:RHS repeat-associated protein
MTRQYHNLLQLTEDERTKNYTWDFNVVAENDDGESRFYLQDELGSPLRFTSAGGMLVESYSYDEFGNDLYGNQGLMQPFGFTGYQFDNVTQTYFAQAREYMPGLGRFTEEDTHWHPENMIYGDNPVKINEKRDSSGLHIHTLEPDIGAILQSSNLNVYCGNNPIMFTDPTGNDYAMTAGFAGTMWWLTMVDGPIIPVGDIIYGLGVGGCAIVDTIGVDNIVRFATACPDAARNVANSVGNWLQKTFGGSGSSSPGDPNNWNHRDYLLEQAQNEELRNAISELYRANAIIGDGGTADMLRNEIATGDTLKHLQKAQDSIKYLNRILETQTLTSSETKITYQLLNDLYDAIKQVPK